MSIDFLSPGYLLLAAAVPLVWILPRRLRDIGLGLLRSAILVLVIVAAARPVSYGEDARAWHVVVLDASASLGADGERARDVADRRLGRVPAGDQTALVIVGTSEDAAALAEVPGAEHAVRVGGARGGSPLGAGLAAASRAIPAGARGSVTLISDGLATDRHWGSAAAELSARGIPVHVVAVTPAQPTAAVIGVTLPDVLRVGATARVEARVTGAAGVTADVRLLGPAGELAVQRGIVFGSDVSGGDVSGGDGLGSDVPVVLAFEPEAPGFLPLTVRIDAAADSMRADDVLRVTAAVQDPLRVLYLGRRMVEGDARLDELVGRGFALTSVPTGEPLTPRHVAAADLVVIDDRPADTVPAPVQEAVASAVREGRTGLLMCGGRAAFGAGGYARSPLAAVLPVEMVQKEEKRDPSTTLAIVIDTSGSMGGNRVQLAKEVARLAIRRLLPHDKVGIVEFYGAKRWAAPIQPASNAIEIQRALNRLNAGGGTVIMPAIEEAFYGLQNVRTRYKHVLVLTDGGVEQGAFEPLVRRMASKGITVSTVLIGPDAHSEFLVSIANWGKGRFYSVPNRFNLPEILLKQPASAHLPSWRPGPHAVDPRGGPGWWGAQDGAQVPALGGYVESRARTGAETLLEVRSTRHPVLATWRYGAGRATALLTEPTGPGTSAWRNWEGYGEALARVLARTASDTRPPYAFELARRGRALTLSARRQTPSASAPAARRVDSAGAPLRFRERAPGFFEARFDAAPESEVRVAAGVAGTLDTKLVSSARADLTPELQVDPRNALDMALLAGATGGEFAALADADRLPLRSGGGSAPAAVRPIWPWCLLLALILYLLELAWRRRSRSLRTEMDA